MKPEKQQLLDELIGAESRSAGTLLTASKILRRRRQWRVTRQVVALIILMAATAWLLEQKNQRQMSAHASAPEAKRPAPPPAVHSLTDAELLALFPDTPVGLATLPNGKKLLIFPRPADAAKYITRL
ncbi:MAG TPA: hypothetical protein VH251_10435 [Verrucomicrobiae bacterium]|jgi:glucose/arabinose dehydrogenase|nr:hypothetical protein [Verrucomicrobiae bacterium]